MGSTVATITPSKEPLLFSIRRESWSTHCSVAPSLLGLPITRWSLARLHGPYSSRLPDSPAKQETVAARGRQLYTSVATYNCDLQASSVRIRLAFSQSTRANLPGSRTSSPDNLERPVDLVERAKDVLRTLPPNLLSFELPHVPRCRARSSKRRTQPSTLGL